MRLLYQALTDYLLGYLPLNYQPNFYSWMSKIKIINEGQTVVEQGEFLTESVQVCEIEYDAVLWFEALPFKQIDPLKLMVLLNTWVQDCSNPYHDGAHDSYNYNQQIEGELTPIDDETADLDFTLTFREPIYLVRDERGEIPLNGERYRLANIEIFTLENVPMRARYIERKRQLKADGDRI